MGHSPTLRIRRILKNPKEKWKCKTTKNQTQKNWFVSLQQKWYGGQCWHTSRADMASNRLKCSPWISSPTSNSERFPKSPKTHFLCILKKAHVTTNNRAIKSKIGIKPSTEQKWGFWCRGFLSYPENLILFLQTLIHKYTQQIHVYHVCTCGDVHPKGNEEKWEQKKMGKKKGERKNLHKQRRRTQKHQPMLSDLLLQQQQWALQHSLLLVLLPGAIRAPSSSCHHAPIKWQKTLPMILPLDLLYSSSSSPHMKTSLRSSDDWYSSSSSSSSSSSLNMKPVVAEFHW